MTSHPDFREPPQGHIRKCACGREIVGDFFGYEDDEIGCTCGKLGEWKWELQYAEKHPRRGCSDG